MKNLIWTVVSVFVLLLQIAAEVVAAMFVLRLGMLPEKYTVIFAIVMALAVFIPAALFFIRGKNPVSTARRIVAIVLALLVIAGCLLVSKLASDAYETMHSVTNDTETTDEQNMYVFVRTDDPAQNLSDAKNYTFAIIENYDVEHTQNAVAFIELQTGNSITVKQYETTTALADALLNKQVDALIVNGVAIALLTEEEAYADFMDKVRILYAMPLEDLEETEPSTEATEPQTEPQPDDITQKPFVMYLSGSDTRNKKLRVSRSDVNILVVVNPVTKQILLVNTPRDYYVPNPAGNGALDKLTHCGLYGTSCSMGALSGLYGVEIQYYAQINFTGFETLVDAVGGVTVYSDQSFKADDGQDFPKGENQLNGKRALSFARERHHVSGGDNGRGRNQMKVITALIKKMTSGTTIISNYSNILKSLEGMFKTSFDMEDVSKLVKMQLSDMADWNIKSFAVTGRGGKETNYSSPGHKAYVMYPNENVVAYASELMQRVLSGQTLTDADMKLPK